MGGLDKKMMKRVAKNIYVQPMDTDNSVMNGGGWVEVGKGWGDICNSINNKKKRKEKKQQFS